MPSTQPLRVAIEGDELVIRIGIDTLAFASENNDSWFEWDYASASFVQVWKVVDNRGWAEDIVRELKREEEDGSTPLSSLIDKMSEKALDQGSLSVWSPELGIPDPEDEE